MRLPSDVTAFCPCTNLLHAPIHRQSNMKLHPHPVTHIHPNSYQHQRMPTRHTHPPLYHSQSLLLPPSIIPSNSLSLSLSLLLSFSLVSPCQRPSITLSPSPSPPSLSHPSHLANRLGSILNSTHTRTSNTGTIDPVHTGSNL
jgi:hypothetical protein